MTKKNKAVEQQSTEGPPFEEVPATDVPPQNLPEPIPTEDMTFPECDGDAPTTKEEE